ncbi:MAG: DUF5681 domain-containing protein [Rhodospirillales bacterium]|nr:DUF5681 domain-containing protein [Rhodospirillales bacterium]
MADVEKSEQKQRRGGFQPGQSGNPRGKPKGARNRVLLALDGIGGDAAADVLAAAVTAAKAGDMRAAELILSRVWPARKGRPVSLPDMPSMADAGGLVAATAAVAEAVADGTLTPDEAQAVAAVLESQRKAIETADLAARIERLEQQR